VGIFTRSKPRAPLSTRAVAEFRLEMPLGEVYSACRHAIAGMGWEVGSIEPTRIGTHRGAWGFSRNATRVDIWLFRNHAATTVSLDGRVFGRRARSRTYLADELTRLRNAVESAAHRAIDEARAGDARGRWPYRASSAPARP
jgi:hypothetical protein